jgi:proteasome assembly chaperone (PAC2) family protein
MANEVRLNNPWLVAVWPGMGNVAIAAGYYLMAKLDMHILAEFPAHELFDVEHIEVKQGLIHPGRLPRSRFFVWIDPSGRHDIVVFLGEAQPSKSRYAFCRRFVEFAQALGVTRVFTFAAMATQMHPEAASRIFVAATDSEMLRELTERNLDLLDDGQIGGLNGMLLGAAAEAGLRGACLLGEMPQVFAQLPFPKASLTVLQAFTKIAEIEIDLGELTEQANEMEHKLGELLTQMQQEIEQQMPEEDDETIRQQPAEEEDVKSEDKERIERLFRQAEKDRSSAYELKRVLDRLGVYREYENRFLDLFKKRD